MASGRDSGWLGGLYVSGVVDDVVDDIADVAGQVNDLGLLVLFVLPAVLISTGVVVVVGACRSGSVLAIAVGTVTLLLAATSSLAVVLAVDLIDDLDTVEFLDDVEPILADSSLPSLVVVQAALAMATAVLLVMWVARRPRSVAGRRLGRLAAAMVAASAVAGVAGAALDRSMLHTDYLYERVARVGSPPLVWVILLDVAGSLVASAGAIAVVRADRQDRTLASPVAVRG